MNLKTEKNPINKSQKYIEEARHYRKANELALVSEKHLQEIEFSKLKNNKFDIDKYYPDKDLSSKATEIFKADGTHANGTFWVIPLVVGITYNLKGDVWEFTLTILNMAMASTYLSPNKLGGSLGMNSLFTKASFGLYFSDKGLSIEGSVCLRDMLGDFEYKCCNINKVIIPFKELP